MATQSNFPIIIYFVLLEFWGNPLLSSLSLKVHATLPNIELPPPTPSIHAYQIKNSVVSFFSKFLELDFESSLVLVCGRRRVISWGIYRTLPPLETHVYKLLAFSAIFFQQGLCSLWYFDDLTSDFCHFCR